MLASGEPFLASKKSLGKRTVLLCKTGIVCKKDKKLLNKIKAWNKPVTWVQIPMGSFAIATAIATPVDGFPKLFSKKKGFSNPNGVIPKNISSELCD